MDFSDFQKGFKKKMGGDKINPRLHNPSRDLVNYTAQLSDKIYDWLNENGWLKASTDNMFAESRENISLASSVTEDTVDKIDKLLNMIGLDSASPENRTIAGEIVYSAISSTLGKKSAAAWQHHFGQGQMRNARANEKLVQVGIESFMPESVMREFINPAQLSQESFGVDMDKSIPDMRTSIAIGIMRFFQSGTGRMFAKKMLTEPMIYINTDEVNIYKTDSTDPEIPMVELNRDPDVVSVELTKIVALKANDAANNLSEDGYVRFGATASLMKLSLDSTKPAFASANKTDLISEDVKLESVVLTFSDGTDTESFEFKVPSALARLTYSTNAMTSKRVANIVWTAYIYRTSLNRAGGATAVFNGLHANDVCTVTITANPTVDLRTGEFTLTGGMKLAVQNATSATTAVDATTTAALAAVATQTMVSGKPDARFSEENLKKTNIGAEVLTRTYSYTVPVGRNYFIDYAYTQAMDADRGTAILMNIINYGIDSRTVKTIKEKIEETRDKWVSPVPTPGQYFQPGTGYVCSNRIKPYGYVGTLDCSLYESMKELEKMADIHTAARIKFNAIAALIEAKSYVGSQLMGGMPVYRLMTDPQLLGNILGIGHMHDRLKASAPAVPANGAVNAVVMLDSGVTFEIISLPFQSLENKIMGIPYMESDPESTLNFAINADMGSLVAHYTSDFVGLKNRLFTNVREVPIVCNPSGFILDVTHMPAETHMS